jgi:integrase
LKVTDLQELQAHLKAKGLKANSVNGVIGGSLRAMLKSARADGIVKVDLYDRAMFSPLPLTDTQSSIDPYLPEERDTILEAFRTKRPHYYAFVFFRFWTGARPSETCALRWQDVDLRYSTARFNKGRVQGHEDGTKNARSNREIHLHDDLVEVLRTHKPLRVKPQDYVFTTPAGTPIDEDNFYHREWLPTLRAKDVRERPFYNTRHAYASFLVSIGAKSGFISAQTGDSIKTIESCYAKYEPDADTMRELVEERISQATKSLQSGFRDGSSPTPSEKKKPPRNQGLKDGAGEEGRTPDLMLGKHTL